MRFLPENFAYKILYSFFAAVHINIIVSNYSRFALYLISSSQTTPLNMTIVVHLFLFAIFARATNAIAGESLGKRPCTELEGTEDESFLKKNLLHLHRSTNQFDEVHIKYAYL